MHFQDALLPSWGDACASRPNSRHATKVISCRVPLLTVADWIAASPATSRDPPNSFVRIFNIHLSQQNSRFNFHAVVRRTGLPVVQMNFARSSPSRQFVTKLLHGCSPSLLNLTHRSLREMFPPAARFSFSYEGYICAGTFRCSPFFPFLLLR